MKKFFLTSALLLVALMVHSQTKIVSEMKKGLKKSYVSETIVKNATLKNPVTITTQTTFEVTDDNTDGYVLDAQITDVRNNANQSDMQGRIMSLSTEMLTISKND